MIQKILIANRGEIAVRIIRACADLGLGSVAVYADQDADALHVRMADEAWALQGRLPAQTYLDAAQLLDIAQRSGADAVHPGYGFLSERADFAEAVIAAGLTWIGPPPAAMAQLGNKVSARRLAREAGAPLAAGTEGPVRDAGEVLAFARQYGLPIAIKAAHGGGGRGLKIARHMEEVAELYQAAVREASAAFGQGDCYVEQYLDRPRHIEAQVLADLHGHVLVIGTRDCSVQRRSQKLVEEAPAPFLDEALRRRVHDAARDICARAGYAGAGTVEFLLSQNGQLSFLEVNTRLQVEHPVTEETSGLDLVAEQIRIADGQPLSLQQAPAPRGHSIEFRINAEDPARGFLPAPGRLAVFSPPSGPGVRIDSGVAAGDSIPGEFDSLMAKLIVTGDTRAQALQRARRALEEFRIEGVPTVLPMHRALLEDPAFNGTAGFAVHTQWLETESHLSLEVSPRPEPSDASSLWRTTIEIDGRRVAIGLPHTLLRLISSNGDTATVQAQPSASLAPPAQDVIAATFEGTLLAWTADDGAVVQEGDPIAVMEAMKMECPVYAPTSGTLRHLVPEGTALAAGSALGRLEINAAP